MACKQPRNQVCLSASSSRANRFKALRWEHKCTGISCEASISTFWLILSSKQEGSGQGWCGEGKIEECNQLLFFTDIVSMHMMKRTSCRARLIHFRACHTEVDWKRHEILHFTAGHGLWTADFLGRELLTLCTILNECGVTGYCSSWLGSSWLGCVVPPGLLRRRARSTDLPSLVGGCCCRFTKSLQAPHQ